MKESDSKKTRLGLSLGSVVSKRAGAMFDWTFFDNSNRRKVVRQPSKVVMFDSDLV